MRKEYDLMSIEKEFVDYLNKEGFNRFKREWIKKYKQLGHLGGKIELNDLNNQEKECLEGLLGLDLSSGYLSLTYVNLLKYINQTRYEGVDFLKVLTLIYGEKIDTNQEIRDKLNDSLNNYKEKTLMKYQGTHAHEWLKSYFENESNIKKHFNEKNDNSLLHHVCIALNELPVYQEEYALLSIFSYQMTKDPHYFDEGNARELLKRGISYLLDCDKESAFNQAGILKDDLSNYCYISHIMTQENNTCFKDFYNNYEPWNINLYNLKQIQGLFRKQKIFIFENPSVFRDLFLFAKEKNLDIGLVCSNGQINYCTYLLLDRLVKSECCLYYCGDFDPEGLLIAEKLKKRYQNKLHLFEYTEDNFNLVKKKQKHISQKRKTLLNRIENKELQKIASIILNEYVFGYQEGLIEVYKRKIEQCINK